MPVNNDMTNKNNFTVSIGIPSYEVGNSLVTTMKSIYKQSAIKDVLEIIVALDGQKLSPDIASRIQHPKLRVIEFPKRLGQSARINSICKKARGDLLIFTNDDVVLDINAIEQLIKMFHKTKADLIAGLARPMRPTTFIRKILQIGWEINTRIAKSWNNGNNYLSCNGRLVALTKTFRNKVNIPPIIWNNDAYMYLLTQIRGFKFSPAVGATVYYQLPNTILDHIRQSTKFQRSYNENLRFFSEDISVFYKTRPGLVTSAVMHVLVRKPIYTMIYIVVLIITRVVAFFYSPENNLGYWDTDVSTKALSTSGL